MSVEDFKTTGKGKNKNGKNKNGIKMEDLMEELKNYRLSA